MTVLSVEQHPTSSVPRFTGALDDITVMNRALSAAQLVQLMKLGAGYSTSECYTDSRAADYRGSIAKTKSGRACLSWNIQKKIDGRSGYWTGDTGATAKGVADHNYCRNPSGHFTAWCHTGFENTGAPSMVPRLLPVYAAWASE